MNALRALQPLKSTYLHPKYRRFVADFRKFERLYAGSVRDLELRWTHRYPCLDDNTAATTFDAHYTYHPAWAARIIAQTKPPLHIDISSSLNFCTMVSAFVAVEFYDLRPVEISLSGLECKRGDLVRLPFETGSVGSLSCMHVVEHIGLGRYGDPLDPEGDLKAIAELTRVLARGGTLMFVTPVGHPQIRFNAHRIYSYDQVASYFGGLNTQQFALVDDRGEFTVGADPDYANRQDYGCGCWWFKK